ncbi:MAG TPA: hypothetical protein VFS04_03760 [Alphaproteobacteria bacterium]|nr:hypothetical protein [Alphaproteobacteria bacterium]
MHYFVSLRASPNQQYLLMKAYPFGTWRTSSRQDDDGLNRWSIEFTTHAEASEFIACAQRHGCNADLLEAREIEERPNLGYAAQEVGERKI